MAAGPAMAAPELVQNPTPAHSRWSARSGLGRSHDSQLGVPAILYQKAQGRTFTPSGRG